MTVSDDVSDFEPGSARGDKADQLVDELLPDELDWEHLVRTYPIPALIACAAAGFWLGMRRGPVLTAAVAGWAAQQMTRKVNDFVGDEVL